MKKEIAKKVLDALANAHPVNTSDDFSVSIRDWSDYGLDSVWFTVFSNLPSGSFVEYSISLFLSLAHVYGVNISADAKHGVCVFRIS